MKRPVEIGRFGQRAAALVAEIDDHAVDLVLLELAEQTLDIARRALVVGVAATARVEILIERRQRDHADMARVIAGLDLDHRFLRGLLFDADLLARQRERLVLAVGAGVGGQDFQAHDRILRAADLFHDIVEAPADHVDDRAVLALADADDAITDLVLARQRGRAARHDLANRGVVLVVTLQHRAGCPRARASSRCRNSPMRAGPGSSCAARSPSHRHS